MKSKQCISPFLLMIILLTGCDLPPHVQNPDLPTPPKSQTLILPENATPEEVDFFHYAQADNYALTDKFGSLRTGVSKSAVLLRLDAPTSSGETNDDLHLKSAFPDLRYQYFEDYEVVVLYDNDELTTGYVVGWKM